MSASLMWSPIAKGTRLPDDLKFVLRKKSEWEGKQVYSEAVVPYLRGLADAGINGAQELIDAIEKYGEVEVWMEY